METIPRNLKTLSSSFFLFGPRGSGKSTWLRQHFPEALWIDLLDPREQRIFRAHPEHLLERLMGDPERTLVVIDEIQKVPTLLDVIHWEGWTLTNLLPKYLCRSLFHLAKYLSTNRPLQSVRFHSSSDSTVACYENPNSFSELTKAWNPEIQDFSDFCSEILPQIFTGLAIMHQNVPTFWSPPWVSFSKKYHRVERSLRAILSRWAKSS